MKRVCWSPDEDRVLRWAWRRGIQLTHVCAPLGRSYAAAASRAKRLGLNWREQTEQSGEVA